MEEKKEGGGLWSKIAGKIWEDDGKPDPKRDAPVQSPSSRIQTPVPSGSPFPPAARLTPLPPRPSFAQPAAEPDPAALARLEAKLSTVTPPQYTAVMTQFQNLSDVIVDESLRFKAALKTAGVSLADLSAAVGAMIDAMNAAAKTFDDSSAANSARVAASLEGERSKSDSLIRERQVAIEKLQTEIDAISAELSTRESQAQQDASRIESVTIGFKAAHAVVVKRLNEQKSNIDSQLRVV